MKRNVHSFRISIKRGYSPCLYSYDPQQVPTGEFIAVLDFKTWSKRIIAINCYFTKVDTGTKFVATVYCNYKTGKYTVGNSDIDFSNCALGAMYQIELHKTLKGNIVFRNAAEYLL